MGKQHTNTSPVDSPSTGVTPNRVWSSLPTTEPDGDEVPMVFGIVKGRIGKRKNKSQSRLVRKAALMRLVVDAGQSPFRHLPKDQELAYHQRMPKWATEAVGYAQQTTLAAGFPITVTEANQIIKIFPDGHREVLGTVD
jgi:hypothetical protein